MAAALTRSAVATYLLVMAVVLAHAATADPQPSYKNNGKHKGWYKKPSPALKPALAVQGVVLCQNATYAGTPSLQNATPLPGAKVRATCRNGRRHLRLGDVTASTDANGYFYVRLASSFDIKTYDPTRVCKAFLHSSTNKNCSIATNINYGKVGEPFRPFKPANASAAVKVAVYSVGPFAYAPAKLH